MSDEIEVGSLSLNNNSFEEDDKAKEQSDSTSQQAGPRRKGLLHDIISSDESKFMPWEEAKLPSLGLFYDGAIPGGAIEVRPMNLTLEKNIANSRVRSTQIVDKVFDYCLKLPNNFDHRDLLVGDRLFVMYYIRGVSYGNEYEFTYTCSKCGNSSMVNYDLNELQSTIRYGNPEIVPYPYPIILRDISEKMGSEIVMKLRYITGRDLSSMMQDEYDPDVVTAHSAKIKRSQNGIDPIEFLTKAIVSVEAEGDIITSKSEISAFLNRLSNADLDDIKSFVNEDAPGIDSNISFVCRNCDANVRVPLPITQTFFRSPKRRRA